MSQNFELLAKQAVEDLLKDQTLRDNQVLIVGCSSSEVMGSRIGQASSQEAGNAIGKGILAALSELPKKIHLAAQCCEHLNRALVVNRKVAESNGWELVSAVPYTKAGGAFATKIYNSIDDPVLVEEVKADYGLDIGQTMIGMHLKKVVVPIRIKTNAIGEATITGAKSRPKLIGGIRARYE